MFGVTYSCLHYILQVKKVDNNPEPASCKDEDLDLIEASDNTETEGKFYIMYLVVVLLAHVLAFKNFSSNNS